MPEVNTFIFSFLLWRFLSLFPSQLDLKFYTIALKPSKQKTSRRKKHPCWKISGSFKRSETVSTNLIRVYRTTVSLHFFCSHRRRPKDLYRESSYELDPFIFNAALVDPVSPASFLFSETPVNSGRWMVAVQAISVQK